MSLIVMTFGAAALQGGDLLTIGDTLRQSQQAGNAIIAVVDALPGVADMLRQGTELGSYSRVHNKLKSIHSNVARKLIRDERDRALLIHDIEDILGSYQWLGRSIVNRQPTPTEAATMLATGERLSARLLATYLQHRGVPAHVLNSHEFLINDDDSGTATIDLERSRQRCVDVITPLIDSGTLVIVACTGSSNGDNRPLRLAEDSLHLTASLLAAMQQADGLWIMKHKDGILSADPDYVTGATTIPVLTTNTLSDLADYGVEIPHITTLSAAIEARIPIFVRSIFQPTHPGTYIQPWTNAASTPIGPIVIQNPVGSIRASGLDPQAALATLHANGIPAVRSDEGAAFFVNQAHLSRARHALNQFSADATLGEQPDSQALVSLLNIHASSQNGLRDDMQAILRNLGIAPLQILSTLGRSGDTNLSTLVPSESVAAVVNEVHNLLRSLEQ